MCFTILSKSGYLNRFNAVLIVWCDSVQLLFVVFKILELKVGCLRNYFAIDM